MAFGARPDVYRGWVPSDFTQGLVGNDQQVHRIHLFLLGINDRCGSYAASDLARDSERSKPANADSYAVDTPRDVGCESLRKHLVTFSVSQAVTSLSSCVKRGDVCSDCVELHAACCVVRELVHSIGCSRTGFLFWMRGFSQYDGDAGWQNVKPSLLLQSG